MMINNLLQGPLKETKFAVGLNQDIKIFLKQRVFNIKDTPIDKRAQRSLEKVNIERIAKAQAKQPKTPQEDISRIGKDIGELSLTAKRLEELDIDPSAIVGQIEAKSDSIDAISKGIRDAQRIANKPKRRKAVMALPKTDIQSLKVQINQVLRVAMLKKDEGSIATVAQEFEEKFGITLQELNELAK